MFKNKTILITGGTGSFGQKFVELVLKEHNPEAVRIFSRGELLQMQMKERFKNDERLRFFIGDVRDKYRLHRAIAGTDIVIHAAALKQVPACEYNPIEAVKTNIIGSMNIIDVAIDNKVEKVMLISSDKCAAPINIYGATKLVAEKLFIQGNAYPGQIGTKFGATRYGNVIGSRGSVIPLFKEQLKSGDGITITDEKMTRFWITMEEGVKFVIECINNMTGGEIFVPKISSMKITDLVDAIAPRLKRKIIGIRPSEKLHETLITKEEARHTKEFDDYYIIEPEFTSWGYKKLEGDSPPDDFTYSSNTNDKWLTQKKLKEMI